MSDLSSVDAAELFALRLQKDIRVQSSGGSVCQEVANRAKPFEALVDQAFDIPSHCRSAEDRDLFDFSCTLGKLLYRTGGVEGNEIRESLAHWVLASVAARNAVARMADSGQLKMPPAKAS
jgi:hypothetical protein